jgi:competence protein ComGC
MADVFISYAKADRPLALKLAAMLEAEGWKAWWDTSLTIGDDFRNEIMTELGRARAVIVIWTDASIKSDWVRSEAGRAQADRKLIPVKLPHLTYKDLPPPFDVLHTEDVGEEDKIKAAVVAQLAKPAVEPSAVALLAKGFKYEVLTWVGIVGGALTLFTNLGAVLKLADWARLLVQHWKEWTHAFWLWTFGWLGIHLAPEWTPPLSFLLFALLLAVGQAVKFKSTTKGKTTVAQGKSFQLISWRTGFCLVSILAIFLLVYIVSIIDSPNFFADETTLNTTQKVAACLLLCPQVMVVLFSRHRLHASLSVLLLFVFFWIIIVTPYQSMGASATHTTLAGVSTILSTWFIPLIILSVAPAKAISRRLIFLGLGLLLLIALNELSKLGLDATAPKLQG